MKRTTTAALCLLGAVVLYGSAIEPRFLLDDVSFVAELPHLRDGWDGQTVALVSDFQVGMWLGNASMVEEAIEDAVEDSVAAILIAGDFVYRPDSSRVRAAVDLLHPATEAEIPVLAVLGNHDYSLMKQHSEINPVAADYLIERLEAVGVRVLQNESAPVVANGDTLWVVGVGSTWAGLADVEAALATVPAAAPRVWLMHNSEAFRDIPGGAAHLALAGHTHGGQVRVIPGEHRSWLDIVQRGEVAADGWAADSIGQPPNRIYINRGIGFSTIPIRINCRPELTQITLRQPTGRALSQGRGEVEGTDS